jgi:hypothetical protein
MIVLPDDLPPLNLRIIRLAQADVPILENPPLSNTSPEIDAMCREFGVPLKSYWCALWKSKIWTAAGAAIPPINARRGWHPAIAETWRQWALEEGLFSDVPELGRGTLYGTHGDPPAEHVGVCLASIEPIKMDFEGNTSGAGYARNGELATIKPVDGDRLIGYVTPRAA